MIEVLFLLWGMYLGYKVDTLRNKVLDLEPQIESNKQESN